MSKPGYVYILSNESMPGLIKIGKSINGGKSRALNLYQTGVPQPFNLEFELLTNNVHSLEKLVHDRLSKNRVHIGREFFKISVYEAIEAVLIEFSNEMDLRVTPMDFSVDERVMQCLDYELHAQGIRLAPPVIYAAMDHLTVDDVINPLILYYEECNERSKIYGQD